MNNQSTISLEELKFVKNLGSGYSSVVKLMRDANGVSYAVKFPSREDPDVILAFTNEYTILKELELAGVRGIVPKAYNLTLDGQNSFMVMEALGKTLRQEMDETRSYFSEKEALQIGLQLLPHVRQIHEAGFSHGDIAPQNIIRRGSDTHDRNNLCLIDFERGDQKCNYVEGSVLSFNECCNKDIFSLFFTVCLLAGSTGREPDSRLKKLEDYKTAYMTSLMTRNRFRNNNELEMCAAPVDYEFVKKLMTDAVSLP